MSYGSLPGAEASDAVPHVSNDSSIQAERQGKSVVRRMALATLLVTSAGLAAVGVHSRSAAAATTANLAAGGTREMHWSGSSEAMDDLSAQELVSKMTMAEKISLVGGEGFYPRPSLVVHPPPLVSRQPLFPPRPPIPPCPHHRTVTRPKRHLVQRRNKCD